MCDSVEISKVSFSLGGRYCQNDNTLLNIPSETCGCLMLCCLQMARMISYVQRGKLDTHYAWHVSALSCVLTVARDKKMMFTVR